MKEPVQDRNKDHLHPLFREPLEAWLAATRAKGFRVLVYETFRTLPRQRYLFALGRTIPPWGKFVTYTLDSCHRYGIAADVVPMDAQGRAMWNGYDRLYRAVPPAAFGLELLDFERPHLQLTGGQVRAHHLGIKADVIVGSTHVVPKTRGMRSADEPELPVQWQMDSDGPRKRSGK
jgi:peptidoglycan LD-endopeptidase CwlK